MSYANLLDAIDDNYDALEHLTENEQIEFLQEKFQTDRSVARRALLEFGIIEED